MRASRTELSESLEKPVSNVSQMCKLDLVTATQTYSSFDRRKRQTSSSSLWLHQLLDICISDCVTSAPETVSIELVVVVQLKSSNGTCSNQPIHTCSWQEFQNKWTTSTDTTKYSDDWLKALIWGNILLVLKQWPKTRLLIMKGYYSMYIIFIYILADGLFKISVDPGWIFCSLRPFHTWQGAETSKLPHVPVAHHFAQLR